MCKHRAQIRPSAAIKNRNFITKFEHLCAEVRTSTSTLEFKDARTTVACILRSFFRVVSPSARLLAQHASRRAASEYARRVRACERSPRAYGCLTLQRATVSLRLSRVATPSLSRSAATTLHVHDRTHQRYHRPRSEDRQPFALASIKIDRSCSPRPIHRMKINWENVLRRIVSVLTTSRSRRSLKAFRCFKGNPWTNLRDKSRLWETPWRNSEHPRYLVEV